MLCAKIGWNWLSGSGEEIFLISSMYFRLFCNNLPLEMGWVLHLNKLASSSPKHALWQVWLKMAKWFWRRRFLDFVNVFSLFRNYLSLEKGGALHLNKLESPSPKDALCQVWLKLAQWFWRKRWKCEKFTDGRTDGRTDRQRDGQTERRTDRGQTKGVQKSSLELSAQVS